jgi:O-methyltransferase
MSVWGNAREMYLNLLKDTLVNRIYAKHEYIDLTRSDGRLKKFLGWFFYVQLTLIRATFPRYESYLSGRPLLSKECDWSKREVGRDWPPYAYTMVGRLRLDNLHKAMDNVLNNDVQGDFVEAGVWRGGACIFIAGYLKAHGILNRKVWLMDSFEGLPKPNAKEYPQDAGDYHHTFSQLAVDVETVKENFRVFDLLDSNVKFVKGYFSDTAAPTAGMIDKIAILRLDGDMYESTMVILESLYPKLSPGGMLIIDDYSLPNCKKAIQDYRDRYAIFDEIIDIDESSSYWKKTGNEQYRSWGTLAKS